MEPNIPTPVMVPPSQRPKNTEQGAEPVAPQAPTAEAASVPLATIIRTMKSDSAKAIAERGETLVSISLAEEKKKVAERAAAQAAVATQAPQAPQAPQPPTPAAPKPIGRIIIVIGAILLIGGLAFAAIYLLPKLRTVSLPSVSLPSFGTPAPQETVPTTPTPTQVSLAPSLIPAQLEKRLEVGKDTAEHLFALIAVERTGGVPAGSIKNLYFAEETTTPEGGAQTTAISANRLLLLADTATPDILARSLEAPFMAGLLGEESGATTPFLIIKVSGYDTGLAGMLAWEKDLPRFFDTVFGTKFLSTPLIGTKFRDTTVAGRDTRMFESLMAGSIVYTFANPSTIVIAGSKNTLQKVTALLPTQ